MKLTLLESLTLAEARDPNLKYTYKEVKKQIDRVAVELTKSQSATMTKLADKYKELDLAIKLLAEEKNKINAQIKDKVEGLFDAEDIFYTRVVETVSFTLTVSKQSKSTKVEVDHEAIAEALMALIPAELKAAAEAIKDGYTKVVESTKSPALRVEPKLNEGLLDSLAKIGKFVSGIVKKITSWAVKFDKKLAKIKTMAPLMEEAFQGELLEASMAQRVPDAVLIRGNRAAWYDQANDVNMFGSIISHDTEFVTVGDGKSGSTFQVPKTAISEVLKKAPATASMVSVWVHPVIVRARTKLTGGITVKPV